MDRTAFKQRMQSLKTYREQNPDKGYWDWKIDAFKNGGEIGDNSPVRVNPYTGKPLASGAITPVMDLRTAADFTPVGDVLAVNDTYQAVKERDWTGAGLAALGVIPFVPSSLKNIRKASQRYIPTVNRNDQQLINEAFGKMAKKNSYLTDVANAKNRIFEQLNSIQYRNRASKVDEIYGTNYNETYDLVNDLYENDFFNLPEVKSMNMEAAGRLQANRQATKRFKEEGIGAGPKDFELLVNPDLYRDPYELANHEINHYTDFIISRNANTSMNNKMLQDLEKSLKTTDDPSYFRKGTEQKAYMNQLRTRMLSDGTISNIDEPVTSSTIKSYMSKLDDKDPIKRTFKQHKSANSYTKWFNTIPLLGIEALGINRYYTNNENE